MFRKLIAMTIISVSLMASISACGSGDKASAADKSTTLNGVWTADDPEMSATISNGTIKIVFVSDDLRGLYWQGTFPKSVSEDTDIVSNGDVTAMNASLMGSGDAKKKFTYSNNQLSFVFGIMGTTKTIHLKQ